MLSSILTMIVCGCLTISPNLNFVWIDLSNYERERENKDCHEKELTLHFWNHEWAVFSKVHEGNHFCYCHYTSVIRVGEVKYPVGHLLGDEG